eukprot:1465973-Lingulodinium_polyedra.AAC.1
MRSSWSPGTACRARSGSVTGGWPASGAAVGSRPAAAHLSRASGVRPGGWAPARSAVAGPIG